MGIRVPEFTYENGEARAYSGERYWYIVLRSSGTLKLRHDKTADIFLVGGGGAGGAGNGAGGGGGGYVRTVRGVSLLSEEKNGDGYSIVVGKGGEAKASGWAAGADGEKTTAFGYTVQGGKGGMLYNSSDKHDVGAPGGAGGSGGGAGVYDKGETGGAGGYNGGSGASTSHAAGGKGAGTGTRGFGQNIDDKISGGYDPYVLYAGGGGGSSRSATGGAAGQGGGGKGGGEPDEIEHGGDGKANTGGGGGGASWNGRGGNGGSGVVIIRSTMPDYLPVYFDGTRLTDIYYKTGNAGTPQKAESLTFNGRKIF